MLDSFYDPESIGIMDEEGSSYELEQVKKISEAISSKNGHYYVLLATFRGRKT